MEDLSESGETKETVAQPKEVKAMFTHTTISAPGSGYTLEHLRQTPPEDKKSIYCVRFDPEDSKLIAIGSCSSPTCRLL